MKILVVDDERKMGVILAGALRDWNHEVTAVSSSREALAELERAPFDLVLTDLMMAPPDGLALLEETRRRRPGTDVILMTAYATAETAVRAMKLGARDYLIKPFDLEELKLRVDQLETTRNLTGEVRRLQTENELLAARVQAQFRFQGLIGRSDSMREVFAQAEAVAATDANVLLRGETGTGKGLLARAIHERSARAAGPFLTVNCGALPEALLESELFGHEKGAFTGAVLKRPGRFKSAEGGTIFLDEIGEMSPALQVKLLQVIEDRSFLPVGGDAVVKADVRIMAATHRDLESMVRDGQFRQDLFFRLCVFPIVLPPLRDRRADIPLLVDETLARFGRAPADLDGEARARLLDYDYPGNIRELEGLLERATILARGGPIRAEHFPSLAGLTLRRSDPTGLSLPEEGVDLEEVEKSFIRLALERTGGNKSRAARLLGMTRRTLYSRMERYGIPLGELEREAGEPDAPPPATGAGDD